MGLFSRPEMVIEVPLPDLHLVPMADPKFDSAARQGRTRIVVELPRMTQKRLAQ